MQLSKSHWLYKVAYTLREYQPDQTSLCVFVRALAVSCLVYWPLTFLLLAIMTAGWVIVNPFCWLVGYYFPAIWENECETLPYRRWWTVGGHRVWPVWFVLAGLVVVGARLVIGDWWLVCLTLAILGCWFTVGAALGMPIGWLLYKRPWRNSPAAQLAVAYLKAKKQRICPLIEFVDDKEAD